VLIQYASLHWAGTIHKRENMLSLYEQASAAPLRTRWVCWACRLRGAAGDAAVAQSETGQGLSAGRGPAATDQPDRSRPAAEGPAGSGPRPDRGRGRIEAGRPRRPGGVASGHAGG
jgi:hypothetical protein